MRNLLILGTGPHACEMVDIVHRVNLAEQTWNLLGFIAKDQKTVGREFNGYKVIGTLDDLGRHPDACLTTDCDGPNWAGDVPRERFVSLIDPSVFVSRTATIGAGCVLYPGCIVGHNATLGDFVFCLSGCTINHDDVIDDCVTVASRVTLAGAVHVESGCYMGQSCTVRQFLKIGKGSLVGMGAVVVKDVPPNSVMVGNPATKLKDRE